MRAFSSAMVFSLSSYAGTSTPARRATTPLAVSQAICTCFVMGSMSGNTRYEVRMVTSIFFASQWAWALSRMVERLPRMLTKRGTLAWYMEMLIEGPGVMVVVVVKGGAGQARILRPAFPTPPQGCPGWPELDGLF